MAVAIDVRVARRTGARQKCHSKGTRRRKPTQNRVTARTLSLTDSTNPPSSTTWGSRRCKPAGPARTPTPRPMKTGCTDQRVSGGSLLVWSCLPTVARPETRPQRWLATQIPDLIVVGHHFLELSQNHRAHESR